MEIVSKSENGRAPNGTVSSIIKELECSDWMKREMIYNEVNRIQKAKAGKNDAISLSETVNFASFHDSYDIIHSNLPSLGGHPKNSSVETKEKRRKSLKHNFRSRQDQSVLPRLKFR